MLTFLLLLVRQLQAHFTSLLWFDVPTGRLATPLAIWHRLLYAPTAARHRLYLSGLVMLFLAPLAAQAQIVPPLISITTPTSICAGQTTTLGVTINLPALTSINALSISAAGPEGITANVGALTTNGTSISVAIPSTVTTGVKSLSVTAFLAGITALALEVPLTVEGLPIVSPNTALPVSATVGSLLTLGSCPIGNVLSYTVTNTSTGIDVASGIGLLPLNANVAGQSVRIACTGGTCAGLPTTFALPNLAGLSLNAPSVAVCAGAPVSLTLVPTGINLAQTGISVTAATPTGSLDVSALGPDGVLTISGGNLTVGNPTSVTVTVNVAGQPLVSASVNLNVLALPAAPTQPGTLTANVGSVLSVTGLCPTGTTLTTGALTGTGIIPVVTTTAGTQSLTVLCSSGTCLSAPTIVNVQVNQPALSILPPAQVCVGAPVSLTLLPTGLDLSQTGLTLTAATPSGALDVSALGPNGVLTISGANLTVGNPTSVTLTASLGSLTLVSASVNVNVLAQPAAPTQPGTLTATVGSVLSVTGLCPTGTTLTTGALTGSGIIPVVTTTAGTQSLTVLCSNGTCLSLPTIVDVLVNQPVLSILPPAQVCVGVPLALTLVPTGFDLSQTGLALTAATPSGALNVSALGPNGVLTISGANLTVGNPTSVTVTASLGSLTLVSASVNVNVLAQPAAPTQPGTLTATVGSVLSVTGLCPTSTTLTTGALTGSGSIIVPTVTAGAQNLNVFCTNGTCLSPPTNVVVTIVNPIFSVSAVASTCLGQPLSLTVLPTNFGLNDGVVSLSVTGPAGISTSLLSNDGVITVTGLQAGNQTLTVTASVAGVPLLSVQVPVVVVNTVPAPTVVTASNGTYPSGVSSLTVAQNSSGVLFNVSCSSGTSSYTGTGGVTGSGDFTVPTSTLGVFSYSVVCTNAPCVSPATVVSVTVVTPGNQPPVVVTALTSPQTATVNATFSTSTAQAFSDPEGGPLTYTAGPLPAGITINTQTGVISGTASTTVGSPFSVTVTATDNQQASVSASFILNVVEANQAPVLTSTPITSPQTATVGVGFSTPTAQAFSDPEGGPLTYTAGPLPAGITINTQTGVISGTASTTVGSPFTVTVTATDPQSASVSTTFVLNVVEPTVVNPGAPFSITSVTTNNCQVISAGERQVTFTPNYAGLNGQTITFQVVNETAPTTNPGPYTLRLYTDNPTIQLRATQAGSAGEASFSYNWLAACGNTPPANQPPVLTGAGITSPQTATVGVGFSTPTAQAFNDPDGGPLTYTAGPLPTGITINTQTGVISGTPSTTVGSPFTVTMTATDPQSASVSTTFVLNVIEANQAPVLTGDGITSPQTATVGIGYTTTTAQAFRDPEGGTLTYSASPLPAGIAINPQTGVISGTASTTVGSPFTVIVTATDPQSASVNASFVLNVVNPAVGNQPPVLTSTPITSPQTATVGVGFSTPTAQAFSDPEGGPLTYTAGPLPAGITINTQTGVISGTASTTVGSPFTVIVTATDPQSASVSTTFVLNVVEPTVVNPGAPFSITSVTTNNCQVISAGERQVTFTPNYAGLNGQTITFRVVNETAPTTNPGPYTLRLYTDNPTIQLRATQAGSAGEASFSYNWLAACGNTPPSNQPPVVVAALTSPQTATVNASFSTPTAQAFSDPEGGPLTYTAGPLPTGIAINTQTGVISGTASTTVGSPFSVIVTATDNQQASVSASFVLNVVNPAVGNQPPVLTSTPITSPQTATVGVGFSTPTAQAFNDPDGGPLTYSTSPLPAGLGINTQTGLISGTPSTTVGSPFTITVTATDPQQASVSTSFVLNVVNPSVPPTTACGSTNLNGAPLQATMPNFTCDQIKTSGNIQFTATGGSANGGPIEYKAIGVTDWTTNCQQIIDRETRTACDAAPIEIQVRQLVNGSYVYGTSYIFDIRRVCPVAGCGGLPTPNRAPVVSAGIPNQVATVGQIFRYNIPANAFTDPDGDELLYMSSRLPDSFTFSSGFFGAYPTTAEVLSVTVTAYDNSGGMASTTFTITVNPNPGSNPPSNPNPPTNPPAPTCGSTNLDNSTLRATAPNVDCEQLKTSGNIQFTATGGSANGGAIEFRAIGVTDWTSNCQQIIDRETRTACDAAPIEIQVRQLVNGSYVYGTSFSFNIRAVCPVAGCGAARVAAEAKAPLDVRVLGNPTRDESVSVDIRGAEGQRLQLMVVDTQGFTVSEHTVDNAGTVEHQTLKLGRQAGTYLLRVQSQTQVQTVKVLKQ